LRVSSTMKNAGKACNNRLYRHIRTFEKIIKNYFVIYVKSMSNFYTHKLFALFVFIICIHYLYTTIGFIKVLSG